MGRDPALWGLCVETCHMPLPISLKRNGVKEGVRKEVWRCFLPKRRRAVNGER